MSDLHSLASLLSRFAQTTLFASGSGHCPLMGAILFGLLTLRVFWSLLAAKTPWHKLLLAPVLVFLAACTIGLLALAGIGNEGDREAARRCQCTNNLKQIGLALHDYHDRYRCFPPAYVADEDGRPLYSWRVLLLPYMEREELYEQFHLDEPWDSEHNRDLLDDLPNHYYSLTCYRCPSDTEAEATKTNYVMIVGANTMSDGPNSRKISEMGDGTSKTIAVIEVAGLGIQWSEPRDLRADEISFRINDPARPGIGSRHFGSGVNAVLVDGSVTFVEAEESPALIRAMTTINGGEDMSAFSVW